MLECNKTLAGWNNKALIMLVIGGVCPNINIVDGYDLAKLINSNIFFLIVASSKYPCLLLNIGIPYEFLL